MRIAHVLRKYDPGQWGGTETAIHRLAQGLAANGASSVVFAPKKGALNLEKDPLAEVGCSIRRFEAYLPIWGISRDERRNMTEVGGNLISFELLPSLLREPAVDIVHSHALGRLGALARSAARSLRIPFVLSVHGGAYDLPPALKSSIAEHTRAGWDWGKPFGFVLGARRLFENADAIVVVNPREAEKIRERHPNKRVVVHSHGVPAAQFALDKRKEALDAFPQLAGRPYLLAPGRIDPIKNQGWLIAQARSLVGRHPRLVLVLAGACTHQDYGNSLRARIRDEGLDECVLLTGQLPSGDPRLIGLFQGADAVVLSGESETFGLVILESWAAGTPVLSSRTSGAMALVKDGENGFLFDLTKPDDFHAAADRFLLDPVLRKRCGDAGRSKAVSDFDTGSVATKMKSLYSELIGEARCTT